MNSTPDGQPATATSALGNQHERLQLLATCLDWDESEHANSVLRRRLSEGSMPWDGLLELTKNEMLAPTLWSRLHRKEATASIPGEMAGYLRRSHMINTIRNRRIKAQLADAIRAMNQQGIEPVLLKGAVDLFVSRYDDSGARILRDVDLFVRQEDIERTQDALVATGYQVVPREAGKFVTYYVELGRPDGLVSFDLQWFISGQRDILPPEPAYAQSILYEIDGLRFRTLSADHQIVHNLLHSELQDRGTDLGFVWLRQLMDLVALCRLLGPQIDWRRVQEPFKRAGHPELVGKRLYMGKRLLGMPMPTAIRPTMAARIHYHRSLAQLRWNWLTATARLWATMSSALDPRLLDLVYASDEKPRWTSMLRLRHAGRLFNRHRHHLGEIIRKRRTKFDQA